MVELALVAGVPPRVISKRFGASDDALYRHRRNHLTAQMKAALLAAVRPSAIDLETLERSEGESLLANLVGQRARLQMLSEMAFAAHELSSATAIERAITSSLELTAKLLGQLVQRSEHRSTSVLISGDYLKLRQAIVLALRPYPEAARAVGRALAELETEAAKDIAERQTPLLLEASPC